MAVQAIIMAGGEGVRLQPLTLHNPKPLAPLLGEPVMGYALKLLRAHGVTDVGATLWYLPRRIRAAFGKGADWGVKLRYYEEPVPMGTAGSMRMAMEHLKDTFFVLSGDGLTDCDLTEALSFHKAKKALATLVLKRVNVPLPYGVVLTDKEGRITRFIEKPTWSRVFSDLVNTGVYILEPDIFNYIPETGMPDFGKDIFPFLLASGLPLYGYETNGYWCDVGDQRAYLMAQLDLLQGKVNLPHPSGIHPDAQVDAAARIEGNCLIGAGAVIGPGAVIRESVIDEKCVVGTGARIENACLWKGAAVMDKARVSGSVLCDGAVVRTGAEVGDGCALGSGSSVGAYALLRPGVKVWPHLTVASGATAVHSVMFGDAGAPKWSPRGADCETPETVCDLCASYIKVTGGKRVILGGSGEGALLSLAAGALAAAGAKALLLTEEATEPMVRALVRFLRLDGGVYAQGQTLRFLDAQGTELTARQRAAMDTCVLRRNAPPAFTRPGSVNRLTGAEEVYLSHILPGENAKALWSPVAVFSDSERMLHWAEEGLRRMDARDVRTGPVRDAALRPNETGFVLSSTGDDLTVFTCENTLTAEEKTMLLLSLCHQKQGKLFDLAGVPRAAEAISPLQENDLGQECAWQRMILEDGLAGMLLIVHALKQGPLHEIMAGLPETHILSRDVMCQPRDKGRILHSLCDRVTQPHTLGEGVRIRHDKGYATIVPDAHQNRVHVTSESGDSEFARELCDFYLDQIRRITGADQEEGGGP